MTKRGITPEQAEEIRKTKGLTSNKFQKVRFESGLSQNDLAVASGISKRTIQCYESGTRPIENARLETLCKFCSVLKCKIEDIIENEALIKLYKKIK